MASNNSDTGVRAWLWDVPVALVLLTRLPLPALPDRAFAHSARATWAYPVVGLVLGLIVALLASLLTALGAAPSVVAGLVLAALIMLSGAMHEDGLADTADGLWGGHDRARRLEIMKDSRIGAYGVLALIVAMGLRWLGLTEVSLSGLITALVVSRAMMVPLMATLPHARDDGLARSVGRAGRIPTLTALLIATACAIALEGAAGLAALCIAAVVAASMRSLALRKIGGQTGDILGATQITTEIAVLLTLITALT